MKYIEKETFIPPDGKLPNVFREAFGRKAKVSIAVEDGDKNTPDEFDGREVKLNALAGKIKSFQKIKHPVQWQRKLRDEWECREQG